MRVVGVTEFGGPEQLGVHEVPEPHAGPGEVRIRVAAVAVNPTDAGVRSGTRDPKGAPAPWVPGMDAAGVVDEAGDGVPFAVGEAVMAIALPLSTHGGAYAEHLVGPWRSMARVPADVDLEQAATLPMNGLTATQMLERLQLQPGEVLAVTGAAGWLGSLLIPLAKRQGAVVVADAQESDRERLIALGADELVERGTDVAARIRERHPDGVDALADLSVQRQEVVASVRDGGRFISVRGWPGEPERGVRFLTTAVFDEYESHEKLDRLRRLAEQGVLTPLVSAALPVDQAAEAHRRMAAGGVRGRIVLTF